MTNTFNIPLRAQIYKGSFHLKKEVYTSYLNIKTLHFDGGKGLNCYIE